MPAVEHARERSRLASRAPAGGDERKVLRVAIADDNRLVVSGVRRALEADDEISVVGEAYGGADVLPLVDRTHPDVVLLDLRMPDVDGLTCLAQIRARHPEVKVIMLSVFTDPEHIEAALSRGASGYIVKSINPNDLAPAVREAAEGTVYHAVGMPEPGEGLAARTGLTEREIGILKAVARGLSNQAIGKELWVTEQTVKFHLTNIYRKLGVSNRTEAARYAFEHNLADDGNDALDE